MVHVRDSQGLISSTLLWRENTILQIQVYWAKHKYHVEHRERNRVITFPLFFQGWWSGGEFHFSSLALLFMFSIVLSWQQTQQAFPEFKNAGSPARSWNYVLTMAAPLVPLLLPPSSLPWKLPVTNGAWAQAASKPSYDRRGVQVLCLPWSS